MRRGVARRLVVLVVAALGLFLLWTWERDPEPIEESTGVAVAPGQAPLLEARGSEPPAAEPALPEAPPEMLAEIERLGRRAALDPNEPWEVTGVVRHATTGKPVRAPLRIVNDLPFHVRDVELRRAVRAVDVGADGSFRCTIDPKVLPAPLFLSASSEWMVLGGRHAWSSRELPDEQPFVVQVVPSFHVTGRVVGNAGSPLRAHIGYPLDLTPGQQSPLGFFCGAATGEEGRFVAGPLPVDRAHWPAGLCGPCPESLTVSAADHAGARFDPWALSPEERNEVVITLDAGVAVSGVVVDTAGRPLTNMPVLAEDREGLWYWPSHTDDRGAFALEHVPNRPVTVRTWDFENDVEGRVRLQLKEPRDDVRIVVRPIELSTPPRVLWVCGVGLVEVDAEIRERYGVRPEAHVMVYDPGSAQALKRGHGVTGANYEEVNSIKEILQLLLAEQKGPLGPMLSITYRDPHSISHVSHDLSIDEKDRTALASLLESMR